MVQNHTKFRMVLMYTLEWFQCRVVPNVSGISEQIFFSVIKKNWWHRWHTLFLAYYRWYKRIIVCQGPWHTLFLAYYRWYKPIIVCQGPWHTVAQSVWLTYMSNKLGFTTTISECTRRARPFLFFRKLFCPKIPLYSIRLI